MPSTTIHPALATQTDEAAQELAHALVALEHVARRTLHCDHAYRPELDTSRALDAVLASYYAPSAASIVRQRVVNAAREALSLRLAARST